MTGGGGICSSNTEIRPDMQEHLLPRGLSGKHVLASPRRPEEMSEEDLIKIIKETITSSGASSIREMGKVIGLIKKSHGDNADMSLVSKHVKLLLNK